jgi:hypothetical protein
LGARTPMPVITTRFRLFMNQGERAKECILHLGAIAF